MTPAPLSRLLAAPRGRRRPARRRQLGQALVEFSLVAPVLFTALMGTLDGGLLLFTNNAANHSASVGEIQLSEAGTDPQADVNAIAAIKAAGLGNTNLAVLDEIDIYRVNVADNGTTTPDPFLVNRYYANGTSTVNWPPSSRRVCLSACGGSSNGATLSQSQLDFAGITVKYHYRYLALKAPSISQQATRYFRLEPQR